jgi:hypothetical protein
MIASRDKDARIWRNKENGHHPMWLKNLFIWIVHIQGLGLTFISSKNG